MSILTTNARKFRENSADSTVFHRPNHSVDLPELVTISRTLPAPRKGNPGTQKISLNYRSTVVLDKGLPTQRTAPAILKIETSIPVGTDVDYIGELFNDAARAISPDNVQGDYVLTTEQKDLFSTGLLPEVPAEFQQQV